jgi:hypothetical protein
LQSFLHGANLLGAFGAAQRRDRVLQGPQFGPREALVEIVHNATIENAPGAA